MKVTKEVQCLLTQITLSLEDLARTATDAAAKWNKCAHGLREKIDKMEIEKPTDPSA